MIDRKRIFGINKICIMTQYISFFWAIGFVVILIFFRLGLYFDSNSLIMLWIVPPLVISIPAFIAHKSLPETDRITYHLYNISKNLQNLGEIDRAEKEIVSSLKTLDDIIQNNEFDTQLFTKSIEDALYMLLENLERLNTYIKRNKKSKEFNNQVASAIKSIADSIRKDDSKITDEFIKAVQRLSLNLKELERTKIIILPYKSIYEALIKYWNKLPNFINIIIISIMIAIMVWFIPEKIGINLSQDTKATITAFFILPAANYYIGKRK